MSQNPASEDKWFLTWCNSLFGPDSANSDVVCFDIIGGYITVKYYPNMTMIRETCVSKSGWDLPARTIFIKKDGTVWK